MEFQNVYQDQVRATAYDELGYGGTYELAFRDLPGLLEEHVGGVRAVDFGCGTGRTSRLLKRLGFLPVGLDISGEMVEIARRNDPFGDYRVIADGDFSSLAATSYDLVLSAFTFDNIPCTARRVQLFRGLKSLLRPAGVLVNIVSTPEIYLNEWATFSTRDFPGNRKANTGDVVRIVTTDYSDARPVDDVLWSDTSYRDLFGQAGLQVIEHLKPLARGDEGIEWPSETRIAPWSIYVLRAGR